MDRETLSEARKHLGTVVDRARHGGKAILLTDHGKPAAVVMPTEKYEEYQRLLTERDERIFRERLTDTSAPAATFHTEDDVRRFFDGLDEPTDGDFAASA